jgi:signal transduction histidine kinase
MSFRFKLLVAMALVVLAVTASGLYFAERKVAAETEHDLQRDFQAALASLHGLQEMRHAALAERCRSLVQKPRIHAALEDNALDLLYPSAEDELRDLVMDEDGQARETAVQVLQGKFYRFLDAKGAVISPPNRHEVGELSADEEAQLAMDGVPDQKQLGYLVRKAGASQAIVEIIAMPISSTETGEAIAAIVLGFNPPELKNTRADMGMKSGTWLNGRLYLPPLAESAQAALASEVTRAAATTGRAESSFTVRIQGTLHRLFYKRLNPGSLYPAAYEVCIYPLSDLLARQRQLRWQAAGACALLLLGGILASHFLSLHLSVPVEKLAVDSAENLAQRQRAEAELELTNEELQRAARFSADASHQLKTPVTVLRTGLEELLARESLTPEMREEISELVHQTYRLASIIEDLLLLSRMDAGRLKLEFTSVNLAQLIEALLDDLSALPDTLDLAIETDFPPALYIAGEKRYTTLIVQNLLENARKYNRPGGRIRVTARADGDRVFLTVGNTGRSIPVEAQKHIFERFHRGAIGENVPGHGLGLNIARELVRIHGGDLRLARSEGGWTEFEVHFRVARQTAVTATELA